MRGLGDQREPSPGFFGPAVPPMLGRVSIRVSLIWDISRGLNQLTLCNIKERGSTEEACRRAMLTLSLLALLLEGEQAYQQR